MVVAPEGDSNRGGVPPVVLARLRRADMVPLGLPVAAGGG